MHWFVFADNQFGVWFYVLVPCRGSSRLAFLEVISLCFCVSAGSFASHTPLFARV